MNGIGAHKIHITLDGERWDTIAYAWYGDPFLFEPIVAANPAVPIFPRNASGQRLRVPILPISEVLPSIEARPPWSE